MQTGSCQLKMRGVNWIHGEKPTMSTGRIAHWGIGRRWNMLPTRVEILKILTFRQAHILGNSQVKN